MGEGCIPVCVRDYFGIRELQASIKLQASISESVSSRPFLNLNKAWRPFRWTEELGKRLRQSVLPHVPLLVFILLEAESAAQRWLGATLAVVYGIPAILAFIVSVVSIPFGIVLALGILPCGWTVPLAGPYLDLTAEPTPPGTWSVIQLRTNVEGKELSHLKAHDDPEVVIKACDWLSSRVPETAGEDQGIR